MTTPVEWQDVPELANDVLLALTALMAQGGSDANMECVRGDEESYPDKFNKLTIQLADGSRYELKLHRIH